MVIRKLSEKVVSFLTRRKLVGTDSFGNKYFVKHEKGLNGEMIEKRLVKYPSGGAFQYDPTKIPPEWHQWLSSSREEVPSGIAPTSTTRDTREKRSPPIRSKNEAIKTPMGSIEN
jgi:NADH:ubiquinone oxidoreductase subunit